jgi:hypothetical protein
MGIGTFILGQLGNSLNKQYRGEFKRLTRDLYSRAPISAVKTMFGFYSYGALVELGVFQGLTREVARGHASEQEYELLRVFAEAKTAGQGTVPDQDARMAAVKLSGIFADAALPELVVIYIEMLKEVQRRNFKTDNLGSYDLFPLAKERAAARRPNLRDKIAELAY